MAVRGVGIGLVAGVGAEQLLEDQHVAGLQPQPVPAALDDARVDVDRRLAGSGTFAVLRRWRGGVRHQSWVDERRRGRTAINAAI